MPVLLHHDGKAHGVHLRVLAGSQRLHDDVLRAVHDDLGSFRFAYALVVQDAVLRPEHPQLTGAEGLAGVAQLRHTCEAFRTGELRVLRAQDGILHYQRVGEAETAEVIVNRSEHIIVEPLASGKHTEVNPMGFTIVVEENGHNPNHSYYDIK